MNIYDKPSGRNGEHVARGIFRHVKGLMFAAAVFVVLTIPIVFNMPMTRIHAGPVAVAPSITKPSIRPLAFRASMVASSG